MSIAPEKGSRSSAQRKAEVHGHPEVVGGAAGLPRTTIRGAAEQIGSATKADLLDDGRRFRDIGPARAIEQAGRETDVVEEIRPSLVIVRALAGLGQVSKGSIEQRPIALAQGQNLVQVATG